VIALHFLGNLTGETMGLSPDMYPFAVALTALVALALVVAWSPESLRGWRTPRPTAG
jgi:uncharacterized protein